jgi:hypothetical protein
MRMDKLTRLRHAQQRIVRVQRRVWLAQVLMWPTAIAAGVSSVSGLVWILRRRYAGGRHEMPDTPGAHEVGTVQIEPDGRLSHVSERPHGACIVDGLSCRQTSVKMSGAKGTRTPELT